MLPRGSGRANACTAQPRRRLAWPWRARATTAPSTTTGSSMPCAVSPAPECPCGRRLPSLRTTSVDLIGSASGERPVTLEESKEGPLNGR